MTIEEMDIRRMLEKGEIPVTKADLIYFHRTLDDAHSELEAAVSDGLVDDSITIAMATAIDMLEQYINDNRD